METSTLIERVRKIEIKTRGLSNNIFAGEYHSIFKGRGMAFSEVREYQYGDAIRDIDWNVTARFGKPYIKVFEEERELTVMLIVDVSASLSLGSKGDIKRNAMTEIAATLAFSAIQNNDKVGLLMFSDTIEKFIPPQKGRRHILRIIRELLHFTPSGHTTNIAQALQYSTNVLKRRCTVFVLSDFMDTASFETALNIANKKHDVMAIRVYDAIEKELPNIGIVRMKDVEHNKEVWFDTSSASARKSYKEFQHRFAEQLSHTFSKAGVDAVSIYSHQDYVRPLLQLFKMR